jgi:type III restriction enzyme
VPFTFLPHEGGDGPPPPLPSPKTRVEPVPDKRGFEISFPNVLRVEHIYRQHLELDLDEVEPLEIRAGEIALTAELSAIVESKPLGELSPIELERLAKELRLQHVIFSTAAGVYDAMQRGWKGSKPYLLAQVVHQVERFLASDRILITPPLFAADPVRRRIILALQMNKIIQHLWDALRPVNSERMEPVFDDRPILSTGDMRLWWTGRPNHPTERSHINVCVYDSAWEASEAFHLDHHPAVQAWVKNDHLGFEVRYIFQGGRRKYRPDFLVRLRDGRMLVLEVKGERSPESDAKHAALADWIAAVNEHGGFGRWTWAVSYEPKGVVEMLDGPSDQVLTGRHLS